MVLCIHARTMEHVTAFHLKSEQQLVAMTKTIEKKISYRALNEIKKLSAFFACVTLVGYATTFSAILLPVTALSLLTYYCIHMIDPLQIYQKREKQVGELKKALSLEDLTVYGEYSKAMKFKSVEELSTLKSKELKTALLTTRKMGGERILAAASALMDSQEKEMRVIGMKIEDTFIEMIGYAKIIGHFYAIVNLNQPENSTEKSSKLSYEHAVAIQTELVNFEDRARRFDPLFINTMRTLKRDPLVSSSLFGDHELINHPNCIDKFPEIFAQLESSP